MIALFTFWRLRGIAPELAQRIGSEAWQAMPRICRESEKATEVLKSTKEGTRVWDGVAIMMAFGVHVVDHYARNFLDQKDRNQLVRRLLSSLMWESKKTMAHFAANEGRSITTMELTKGENALLKLMREVTDKFEQCYLMHLDGPGSRGDLEHTSVDMCGTMLMCGFIEDRDVPQSKLKTWDEMEPKTLQLYDMGRAVAWDYHKRVKEDLYRLLKAKGFQQVRDLGSALKL